MGLVLDFLVLQKEHTPCLGFVFSGRDARARGSGDVAEHTDEEPGRQADELIRSDITRPGQGALAEAADAYLRRHKALAAQLRLEREAAELLRKSAPRVELGAAVERLPASGALGVVGLRVDGLSIGVGVDLDGSKLADWRELGGEPSALPVQLVGWRADWSRSGAGEGRVMLEVRRQREGRWAFRNGDLRGLLEERPLAGCELSVTFSAAFLATNGLSAAIGYARSLGAELGAVRELRLRRVDLAADVAGWEFREDDRSRFLMRSRCQLTEFVELDEGDDVELRVHGTAKRLTGYTVAPGGAVMCRIYDKRQELAVQSPEKAAGEEYIWRSRGWDGSSAVARVEFQLRSEALRSFGLVDPVQLEAGRALDALWQYLTRHWLRLISNDRENRSRCSTDPRWALLQGCQFRHASEPAARQFFRRGATAKHALGTWLSFVASHGATEGGQLVWLPPGASEDEARGVLASMAERWLAAGLGALCDRLVDLEGSAVAAVRYLSERVAAALARSAEVGGGAVPPPGGELVELSSKGKRRKRPAVALWLEAA